MILDGFLQFTAAAGDSPTAQTTTASTNEIDLHGTGLLPTLSSGQGARDMGIGDKPSLKLLVIVTTAFVSAGGATLQVAIQGAADNGSGAAASYSTWWTSPAYTVAQANAGSQLLNLDFPRPPDGVAIPRFVRLAWIIGTSTMSAGTVKAYVVIDRFDQPYSSTDNSVLGGYPAGITIAN